VRSVHGDAGSCAGATRLRPAASPTVLVGVTVARSHEVGRDEAAGGERSPAGARHSSAREPAAALVGLGWRAYHEALPPSPPPAAPESPLRRILRLARRVLAFSWRVGGEFRKNRGFLLASALGYNTLLSIIPLFALVIVVLSTILDGRMLVEVIGAQIDTVMPGRSGIVTEAFAAFVEKRTTIGIIGIVALLFFSAVGFRMLDDAFSVVFHRNRRGRTSHPMRGFVLPLAYVLLIGIGIFALALVMVAFDTLPEEGVRWFGLAVDPSTAVPLIKLLAFVGLVLLVSSFYWVMPVAHVRPWRALVGGLVATTLWEGVRSIMVWYFANLSLVDIVYGSLGTVVVVLLGLEVAAIILLLGAEIIAELERAAVRGRPWHEPADADEH
jgi:membrane protein